MIPAILPGSTIGILGGGQLGRMTALAAARLGYDVVVLTPEADSPAQRVAARTLVAPYDDPQALAALAEAVDVVTLEFENVPTVALEALAARVPVRPGPLALETAQDRRQEKAFFDRVGLPTAPWRPVGSAADLADALAALNTPAILKTARLGYDGKGQSRLTSADDATAAWAALGADAAILEQVVPFEREVSVLIARAPDGATAVYPVMENEHRNHILHRTVAPAAIPEALRAEAEAMARRAAEALDLVGLLAVELFVAPGADGAPMLLANEMAPRPHNSGHWTQDGAATDQFEQLVRAVCGLPLGATEMTGHTAQMLNLLGLDGATAAEALADPAARCTAANARRDPAARWYVNRVWR